MSKTYEQLEPVISALDRRIKTNLEAYPTDTADGSVASFSDGADAPVKSLVVGIEPVQDLHGYDNPWPAGGGKNLFGLSDFTDTYCGVTYAYDSLSGKLSVNGTSTAGAGTNVGEITVPEGTYTFSADFTNYTYTSGFAQILLRDKATDTNAEEIRSDRPQRTVTLNGTYYIRIAAQTNSVNSGYINHIQLELGESKTNFVPYSNICPITGFTGARINTAGENLLDYKTYGRPLPYATAGVTFSENADGSIHASGTAASAAYLNVSFLDTANSAMSAIPFCGKVLTLSTNSQDVLPGLPSYFDENGVTHKMASGSPVPSDAVGLKYFVYVPQGTTIDEDFYPQLELGSTATAYEPYQGESIDISFPTEAGTVYGGSLDVTNGVLTVTKGFIQSYNGETLPSAWISDRDAYAEGATPTTGAEVCYDLATPIVYQLTPTEVKSLLGANNIWADTGDTTVEYRADTKAYIAKKIAEAISALS